MIVPIVSKNDETVGTANVYYMETGEVSVEFYLRPYFKIREDAKKDLTQTLKGLMRKGE